MEESTASVALWAGGWPDPSRALLLPVVGRLVRRVERDFLDRRSVVDGGRSAANLEADHLGACALWRVGGVPGRRRVTRVCRCVDRRPVPWKAYSGGAFGLARRKTDGYRDGIVGVMYRYCDATLRGVDPVCVGLVAGATVALPGTNPMDDSLIYPLRGSYSRRTRTSLPRRR